MQQFRFPAHWLLSATILILFAAFGAVSLGAAASGAAHNPFLRPAPQEPLDLVNLNATVDSNVYEGAPTPVAAAVATGSKVAGFTALPTLPLTAPPRRSACSTVVPAPKTSPSVAPPQAGTLASRGIADPTSALLTAARLFPPRPPTSTIKVELEIREDHVPLPFFARVRHGGLLLIIWRG